MMLRAFTRTYPIQPESPVATASSCRVPRRSTRQADRASLSACPVIAQITKVTQSHIVILDDKPGILLRLAESGEHRIQNTLVLLPPLLPPELLDELVQLKQKSIDTSGILLLAADGADPTEHWNDSRVLGYHIPVFEPSGPAEACRMAPTAFELSREFGIPVLLRLTPGLCQRTEEPRPDKSRFRQDIPACNRSDDSALATARAIALANFADQSDWNLLTSGDPQHRQFGFIAAGANYQIIHINYPAAPLLKLGFSFPLPLKKIRGLIAISQKAIVVETGLPLLEEQIRAEGFSVYGREALY